MSKAIYPKYRWYVLIIFCLAVLAQGMLLIAPTPLVGDIAGLLDTDLGTATAVAVMPFTLMVAIGGILGGYFMDKIGLGKTCTISTALAVVGALCMPLFGHSIPGIIVLRALQGIGCGPLIASGPRVAAEWFPPDERGIYQGITGAALSLGITSGLMAGPFIAAKSGWLGTIAAFGMIMLIALIMLIIYNFGPKSPGHLPDRQSGEKANEEFKLVLKLPVFWCTIICVFCLSWVMQAYNDLTPGHIAVPPPAGLNMGPKLAGAIMGIYTLAFMIGSICSGFITDRIFGGRIKAAVITTFILTAFFCVSVLLPIVNSNPVTLTICLILAGFFMGQPNPNCLTFISKNYPVHITGTVGGLTMGIGIFGGTFGVAAGSTALHITGMYVVSIFIVFAVCIAGALAAIGMNSPGVFKEASRHYSC
ncbi:MFS transporter [Moorella sulfitireducens]|uniref:MFS transporter n=1 Tax=Neomoorella sulfitireducens TaxID=2972948 RepID=UPI0021ACACF5|nr:MFS transporter [Moorella sulfitireducens]